MQTRRVPPTDRRLLPVVALGGAAGALARAGVAAVLPVRPGALPLATLVVNLVGCLLLGLLLARQPGPRRQVFFGTGVLGGFTTFSAFALETDQLLARAPAAALLYVALSVGGGVALAGLGARMGRRR